MDNNVRLGETFVAGRIVNLDTVDVSDLERYIAEVENLKENANLKLKKIAAEIESI